MAVLGVLISNRSFFPAHLVKTAREELLSALEKWGHEVITLSPEDTQVVGVTSLKHKVRQTFPRQYGQAGRHHCLLPNFGGKQASLMLFNGADATFPFSRPTLMAELGEPPRRLLWEAECLQQPGQYVKYSLTKRIRVRWIASSHDIDLSVSVR